MPRDGIQSDGRHNQVAGASGLELLEKYGAVRSGHFELRSGLHSDRYFQCALLMQYPDVMEELSRRLAAMVMERIPTQERPQLVVSPAIGGIILGYEVARVIGCRAVFLEKEGGNLVLRRGFEIRRGERVLVVEDVITRGGRVAQTIEQVNARAAKVVAIAVLVDRRGDDVRLDYPLVSFVRSVPEIWDPARCPLCKKGIPLEHPGS